MVEKNKNPEKNKWPDLPPLESSELPEEIETPLEETIQKVEEILEDPAIEYRKQLHNFLDQPFNTKNMSEIQSLMMVCEDPVLEEKADDFIFEHMQKDEEFLIMQTLYGSKKAKPKALSLLNMNEMSDENLLLLITQSSDEILEKILYEIDITKISEPVIQKLLDDENPVIRRAIALMVADTEGLSEEVYKAILNSSTNKHSGSDNGHDEDLHKRVSKKLSNVSQSVEDLARTAYETKDNAQKLEILEQVGIQNISTEWLVRIHDQLFYDNVGWETEYMSEALDEIVTKVLADPQVTYDQVKLLHNRQDRTDIAKKLLEFPDIEALDLFTIIKNYPDLRNQAIEGLGTNTNGSHGFNIGKLMRSDDLTNNEKQKIFEMEKNRDPVEIGFFHQILRYGPENLKEEAWEIFSTAPELTTENLIGFVSRLSDQIYREKAEKLIIEESDITPDSLLRIMNDSDFEANTRKKAWEKLKDIPFDQWNEYRIGDFFDSEETQQYKSEMENFILEQKNSSAGVLTKILETSDSKENRERAWNQLLKSQDITEKHLFNIVDKASEVFASKAKAKLMENQNINTELLKDIIFYGEDEQLQEFAWKQLTEDQKKFDSTLKEILKSGAEYLEGKGLEYMQKVEIKVLENPNMEYLALIVKEGTEEGKEKAWQALIRTPKLDFATLESIGSWGSEPYRAYAKKLSIVLTEKHWTRFLDGDAYKYL